MLEAVCGCGCRGSNNSRRKFCSQISMHSTHDAPQRPWAGSTCCEVLQNDPGVHHCQRRRHACRARLGRGAPEWVGTDHVAQTTASTQPAACLSRAACLEQESRTKVASVMRRPMDGICEHTCSAAILGLSHGACCQHGKVTTCNLHGMSSHQCSEHMHQQSPGHPFSAHLLPRVWLEGQRVQRMLARPAQVSHRHIAVGPCKRNKRTAHCV